MGILPSINKIFADCWGAMMMVGLEGCCCGGKMNVGFDAGCCEEVMFINIFGSCRWGGEYAGGVQLLQLLEVCLSFFRKL
jgi:hypothetical protein